MTDEPELPDWLKPGARVAVVTGRGFGEHVAFDTVAKVGKLHITLERNDEKFRVRTLDGIKQRDAWTPRPKLHHPGSPEVRRIIAARKLESARSTVRIKTDEWQKVRGKPEERRALSQLRTAVDALQQALDD